MDSKEDQDNIRSQVIDRLVMLLNNFEDNVRGNNIVSVSSREHRDAWLLRIATNKQDYMAFFDSNDEVSASTYTSCYNAFVACLSDLVLEDNLDYCDVCLSYGMSVQELSSMKSWCAQMSRMNSSTLDRTYG